LKDDLMKSPRRKKLAIIFAVLTVVVIAAVLIIPKFFDLNRYNGLITSELEKAMGGKVTLGHLNWGITNGVWLEADGFTVKGATAFPGDIDLSRIYAKVSIPPLLSKRVVVDKLLLENPVVELRLSPPPAREKKAKPKPGSTTPTAGDEPATADKQASASSPLPVEIQIEQLNIQNGRIRLEDSLTLPGQKVVRLFSDVALEANNLAPGQKITFQLTLRDETKPGVGSLKGQGTFKGLTEALAVENPELNLKVTLTDLDVNSLKPYLKNKSLAKRLDGSVSLEVNYKGDIGNNFSADGHIDLSKFAYTDHSIWKKSLPGVETQIKYQISLSPEQINVEKINLQLGNQSLVGQALIQSWKKEPVIKNTLLSADLFLFELIPLVPWGQLGKEADIIRPTLAGGGKVTIEKLSLPDMILTKLPSEPKTLLPKVEASIKVADMSVKPSPGLPKLEGFTGNFRLEKGVLTATNVQGRMGPLTLPTIEARATNLAGKPKVSVAAKGEMQLKGTKDADVEKLLRQYGLKSFSGSAAVDLRADYDQAKPRQWDASGSLVLDGLKAVSYPAGVRLDDLKGRVTLKRKKTLDVTVENLTARVNRAPIALQGKLSGGGTPRLVVDAKARTENLNLADLSSLFSPLKDLELVGKLDMNIDIHYPQTQPKKSRFNGKVKASGLGMRLVAQAVTVKQGNADIELAGNSVNIKNLTLLANDQKITVTGQVTNFEKPTARFQVKSPNLNLDRLLPAAKEDQTPTELTAKPPAKKEGKPKADAPPKKKAGKKELPPFLRDLTAQIQAEAKRGQYRRQKFNDLKFRGQYERGVLKSHEFDIRIAGGRIQTKGSADLRNLERIPFSVQPAITAVKLESIAPLLGVNKFTADGPLTLTGQLAGRTGSTPYLLSSLRGNLNLVAGPGRMYKLGNAGNALFKVLTVLNVESIFSGKTSNDLATEGVPYKSIRAKTSFQAGNMNISQLLLDSPALGMTAIGDVNLVKQRLNIEADMEIVGTVSKLFGMLPIVGKAGVNLTKVHATVDGNLKNPNVHVRPGKGVADAGKQEGDKGVEGLFKGIEKIFGQ
jgi:uncharacterized protein involved in outer membrane biogenesis